MLTCVAMSAVCSTSITPARPAPEAAPSAVEMPFLTSSTVAAVDRSLTAAAATPLPEPPLAWGRPASRRTATDSTHIDGSSRRLLSFVQEAVSRSRQGAVAPETDGVESLLTLDNTCEKENTQFSGRHIGSKLSA